MRPVYCLPLKQQRKVPVVIPLYHSRVGCHECAPSGSDRHHSLQSIAPRIYSTYIHWRKVMGTAKVFRSGNSQAVRLPKEFRFKTKEVEVFRRGDEVVLREKPANLAHAFELLMSLPNDLELPDRKKDLP